MKIVNFTIIKIQKNMAGRQGDESDASDKSEEINENTSNVLSVFKIRCSIENSEMISEQQFVKLKETLTCPICLEIFTDPVYIKDCSHRFCKQCIEKYIRSQEKKSCPTCRKKIGTKRQLRIDENILYFMEKIFGNLKEYHNLTDQQLRKDYERWVINQRTSQEYHKRLSKRQQQLEESQSQQPPVKKKRMITKNTGVAIAQPKLKSRNSHQSMGSVNSSGSHKLEAQEESGSEVQKTSESEVPKEQEEFEQKVKENNSDMGILKDVVLNQELKFSITVKLLRHPDAIWIKQFNRNIFRGPWIMKLADLSVLVSRKLGLNEHKYSKGILFFIKDNAEMLQIQPSITLFELNQKYWKVYKDVEIYEPSEILSKIDRNQQSYDYSGRQLYYYFDLD